MFLRGQVVISTAGRDKNYAQVVVDYDGKYVYVCEGKERRLASPKKKNPRHLIITEWNLTEERMKSDSALRKALRKISPELNEGGKSYVKAGQY